MARTSWQGRAQVGKKRSRNRQAVPARHVRPSLELLEDRLVLDGLFGAAWSMGSAATEDFGTSIDTDAAGNVYVTGHFEGTVDFDPGAGVANRTSSGRDIFVAKYSPTGALVWARNMGSPQGATGEGIAVDAAGNVYTTGNFRGTVDFDPGPGVANRTSNSTLFGSFTVYGAEVFVCKFDPAGNYLWAAEFNGAGASSTGSDIAVDAAGNVYTTGGYQGTIDADPGSGVINLFDAGGGDVFVSKLNAAGQFVWAKHMGGAGGDGATGIGLDAAGNVFVAGGFNGSANFDPNSGITNLTSAGDVDAFAVKLTNAGALVWAKRYGGTLYDDAADVAVGPAGEVCLTGRFQGTVDFNPGTGTFGLVENSTQGTITDTYVSRLDANGNFVWARGMGGDGGDVGSGIDVDAAGNVYTTGSFDTNFFGRPFTITLLTGSVTLIGSEFGSTFVTKWTPAGDLTYARKLAGDLFSNGYAIAADAAGNAVTTGVFNGTCDFDPGTGTFNLTSGGADVFVSKLLVNRAPTAITVPATVPEIVPPNVTFANLTATDDAGDTHTITLVPGPGDTDNAKFSIVGAGLRILVPLDFETGQTSFSLRIRATDQGGLSFEQAFTLTVLNVNELPVITSDGGGDTANLSVAENTTAVTDVNATDPDAATTLTYSLTGGADRLRFAIVPATGVLTFVTAPNYEVPTDANLDNVYTVIVRVSDGAFTDQQTINVTVTNVAEPGQPSDILLTGGTFAEDTAPGTVVGLLAAVDDSGDTHTYSLVGGTGSANNGLFQISGNQLVLTGPADFEATPHPSIRVRTVDSTNQPFEKVLVLTVTDVNESPTAANRTIPTLYNPGFAYTPLNFTLLATDPEHQPLTYVIVSDPSHGTLTGVGANRNYTPAANYVGTDSFTFRVNDGTFNSNLATVSFTIYFPVGTRNPTDLVDPEHASPDPTSDGVNTTPVPYSNVVETDSATPIEIMLTGADEDGDMLAFTLHGPPAQGTLSDFNPFSGGVTYTPAPRSEGAFTFNFSVNDGAEQSDQATITILVSFTNTPPAAEDDYYELDEDTDLVVSAAEGVLANDSDPDGGLLTALVVDGPNYGSVHLLGGGGFTYAPDPDYNGDDFFTYRVRDHAGEFSNVATVNLWINPVNNPPTADDQEAFTDEDTPLTLTLTGDDGDDGEVQALSFQLVAGPAYGTLTAFDEATGEVTYEPDPDFFGTDSFLFRVFDEEGEVSDDATVTIEVAARQGVVANDDAYELDEDISLFVHDGDALLANDENIGAGFYHVQVVDQPEHGFVNMLGGGWFVYAPDDHFNGEDFFTYWVRDPQGEFSNVATVYLTVYPVNNPPTADDQEAATDEDTVLTLTLTGNDGDAREIQDLSFQLAVGPAHGTLLEFDEDTGVVVYEPDPDYFGPDTIVFRVFDEEGEVSPSATVFIEVTPVNDAPHAEDDFYDTDEDTGLIVTLAVGRLANDSDPEGDELRAQLLTFPDHGQIFLNATDGRFSYIPDEDFHGTDTFTYRALDEGGLGSDAATVTITVRPVNDGPEAQNDVYYAVAGQQLQTPSVFANDCDDHGGDPLEGNGPLHGRLADGPAHGHLVFNEDGSFRYTPDPGFTGKDTFTYLVLDARGAPSNQGVVTINVRPGQNAPGNVAEVTATEVRYAVTDVPDFDQRRAFSPLPLPDGIPGLPGDGGMFCVPTAGINLLAYLADHGYPGLAPGAGDWGAAAFDAAHYNAVTEAIANLGQLMNTDAVDGTDGNSVVSGLRAYLDHFGLGDQFVVGAYSGSGSTLARIGDIALTAVSGSYIETGYARYFTTDYLRENRPDLELDDAPDGYYAVGGHAFTLIGATASRLDGTGTITIHDPARGEPKATNRLYTQSPYTSETYHYERAEALPIVWKNEDGTYGMGNYTVNFLTDYDTDVPWTDIVTSYVAIRPLFGLAAEGSELILLNPIFLSGWGGAPASRAPSADGRQITDLAIHPELSLHPYLTAGSDTVWRFNQVTGQSEAWATLDRPQRLTFGGPSQTLFVLEADHLAALNRDGTLRGRVALPAAGVEAISYDDHARQLVAYSSATNRLYYFNDDLTLARSVAVDPGQVSGTAGGRMSLAVDPTDGTLWLHRQGATGLTRVAADPSGNHYRTVNVTNGCGTHVVVRSGDAGDEGGADSVTVDGRGHVFLTLNGQVVELDRDGNRLDSLFQGLPGGQLFQVLRGFDNTDQVPQFVNVPHLDPGEPPVADAGPARTVGEGQPVTLTGSFTDADSPAGHVLTWHVANASGTVVAEVTGAVLVFTPTDDGVYTATFTVVDSDGAFDGATAAITVNNLAPTVAAGPDRSVTEGAGVALAGTFTDPGSADTHMLTWHVTASNGQAISDGAGANYTFTPTNDGTYTVTLTVTDDDGGSATDTVVVNVANAVPVVAAGPDLAILAGNAITASGQFSDPGADQWTATVDYGDGTGTQPLPLGPGRTFTLSHVYATAGVFPVTVRVHDGAATGADTLTVTVSASAETVAVSVRGPAAGVRGQSQAFTLTATATSAANTAAGFSYTVSWGDGTPAQSLPRAPGNGAGVTTDHVYSTAGTYTVRVTATDQAGRSGPPATHTILVTAAAVQADPTDATRLVLVIGGSPGADIILVTSAAGAGRFTVLMSEPGKLPSLTTYGPGISRLAVYGQAGNDVIEVLVTTPVPTLVDGGAGDDLLHAGRGPNVLLGGDGNDTLAGGGGRNVIIGGAGQDVIVAGGGDDLVVGGRTAFDAQALALWQVLGAWDSGQGFADRVARLQTGISAANGGRIAFNGSTVFDDQVVDLVVGGSGRDWFLVNRDLPREHGDLFPDWGVGDSLTDIGPDAFP